MVSCEFCFRSFRDEHKASRHMNTCRVRKLLEKANLYDFTIDLEKYFSKKELETELVKTMLHLISNR